MPSPPQVEGWLLYEPGLYPDMLHPCHCSSNHTAGPVGCLCTAREPSEGPVPAATILRARQACVLGGWEVQPRLPAAVLLVSPLPAFHRPALHSPLRLPVFQWAFQPVKGLPRVREPFSL